MVLILALFAGAGWAETLYDYDADGRLLSATAGGDFSMLDPTPVHNLSDVMVMGDANTNGMPDSLEAYLAEIGDQITTRCNATVMATVCATGMSG